MTKTLVGIALCIVIVIAVAGLWYYFGKQRGYWGKNK